MYGPPQRGNKPRKMSIEYQVLGRDVSITSAEDLRNWQDKTKSVVKQFVYEELPYVQYSNVVLPKVNEPSEVSVGWTDGGLDYLNVRGISVSMRNGFTGSYGTSAFDFNILGGFFQGATYLDDAGRNSASLSVSIQGTALIEQYICTETDMDGNPLEFILEDFPIYYTPAPFGASMTAYADPNSPAAVENNLQAFNSTTWDDTVKLLFSPADDCNGGFMSNQYQSYSLGFSAYGVDDDPSKIGQANMRGIWDNPFALTITVEASVPAPSGDGFRDDDFVIRWNMPEQMKVIYDYTDSEYYKAVNSSPSGIKEQYFISGDDEYNLDGFAFQYFRGEHVEVTQADKVAARNSELTPEEIAEARALLIEENWQDWFTLRQGDSISSDYMFVENPDVTTTANPDTTLTVTGVYARVLGDFVNLDTLTLDTSDYNGLLAFASVLINNVNAGVTVTSIVGTTLTLSGPVTAANNSVISFAFGNTISVPTTRVVVSSVVSVDTGASISNISGVGTNNTHVINSIVTVDAVMNTIDLEKRVTVASNAKIILASDGFTPTLLYNADGEYYKAGQQLRMKKAPPEDAFKYGGESTVTIDDRDFSYSFTEKAWFRVRSIFKCIKPMENAIGKIMPDGVIYTPDSSPYRTDAIILESSSDWCPASNAVRKTFPRSADDAGVIGYSRDTFGHFPSGDATINIIESGSLIMDDTKTMREYLKPTPLPIM